MTHLVLLGDSIFDNAAYVPQGQAVVDHARARAATQDRVTLLACDGSVLADVNAQLARLAALPEPATHLVVSCGGNDVLEWLGAMHTPVSPVIEAVELLATWQASFRRNYQRCSRLSAPPACLLPWRRSTTRSLA